MSGDNFGGDLVNKVLLITWLISLVDYPSSVKIYHNRHKKCFAQEKIKSESTLLARYVDIQ